MSRITFKLAVAVITAIHFVGLAGIVDVQAQARPTRITAEIPPQQDGPHRDPPGEELKPQCPTGWQPVPSGVNPALRCLPGDLLAPTGGAIRTAVPPPGCPAGWKPVPPELNPVLRCQPGSLSIARRPDAAPRPPVGCPEGWRPVPPGVNPILRCLPNEIATPSPARAGRAAPPPGCPTGWRPVSPEVNPMMRCLPAQVVVPTGSLPQRMGPEAGEPIQGAADGVRADPTLAGDF